MMDLVLKLNIIISDSNDEYKKNIVNFRNNYDDLERMKNDKFYFCCLTTPRKLEILIQFTVLVSSKKS